MTATTIDQVDATVQPRADVERLHGAEVDLSRKRLELLTELEGAEIAAGDQVLAATLEGKREPKAATRVEQIRAEIAAIDRAIIAARRQRHDAIHDLWSAQAATRRQEAVTLRTEAAERQKKTDELLAQLREWEGVEFVPKEPRSFRADIASDAGGVLTIPRTVALEQRARSLGKQADSIAERNIVVNGALLAGSRDELIEAVLGWDVLQFAPVLSDVLNWFDSAAVSEADRRRRLPAMDANRVAVDAPVAVEIAWQDGALDVSRCRVMQGG